MKNRNASRPVKAAPAPAPQLTGPDRPTPGFRRRIRLPGAAALPGLLGILLVTSTHATTWVWQGTTTAWNTAANWTPAGVDTDTNGTYADRLTVGSPSGQGITELVYSAAQGNTTYGSSSLRGLAIGTTSGSPGRFHIISGSFTSVGTFLAYADVIGNATTPNTLIVDGSGTYNALGLLLTYGTGTGLQDSLLMSNGIATIGTLYWGESGTIAGYTNLISLNGGTLTITNSVFTGLGTNLLQFNGGTLTVAASSSSFLPAGTNLWVIVSGGGAVINDGGNAVTIGPALMQDAGSTGGGLTKMGAGTLTLSGVNTYTGPTLVNQGALAVALPMSSGSLAMSNGATLTLAVNATNWSALTSVAFTNNVLNLNYGAFTGKTNALLNATSLVLNGTNTINITGTGFTVTNLFLLTYGSKTTAGGSTNLFRLGTLPAGVTATLVDNGSSVVLQVTPAIGSLVWGGQVNNVWDLNTTANWTNGTASVNYLDGAIVIFSDAGFNQTNVSIPATVSPGSITVSNTAVNYGFAGAGGIAGSNSLVKLGTGTLTLSTSNSFTGGVYLTNGGTLYVNNPYALGSTTGGAVSTNSTLEIGTNGGVGITVAGMTNTLLPGGVLRGSTNSSGNNVWAGPVILGADGQTISTEAGGNLTISGNITAQGAGNYGVVFSPGANGTITLSGTGNVWNNGSSKYSYIGGSGRVVLGVNNGLCPTTLVQGSGGTLDLNGYNQTCTGLYGWNAASVIVNNGASLSTITAGGGSANTWLGPVKDGAGRLALVKTGTTVQTLSGLNTYSGATTISAGTLALGASGSSLSNSVLIAIAAGATYDVSAISAYVFTSSNTLSASGTGTTAGTTAASLKGGTTVSLGSQPVTLTFAPTAFAGDSTHPSLYVSAGTLSLNGNAFTVTNAAATPLGAGTYTLLQQASGSISSSGSPTVTVAGTGLATGCTASLSVSGGNVNLVVAVTGSQNLVWYGGDGLWQTNGGYDWNVDTAKYNEANPPTADNVTFNDTATNGTVGIPNVVSPGSITVNNNATNYLFSGAGSISGVTSLVKLGTGTLTLSTSNSFTGGVYLTNGGTLYVNNPYALGSTTGGVFITNASTLEIGTNGGAGVTVTGKTITILGTTSALRGSTNSSGGNVWAGPVSLNGDPSILSTEPGGNLTISGTITTPNSSGVALTPGANGAITLSGTGNSWTGNSTFSEISGSASGKVVLGVNNGLATGTLINLNGGGGATLDLHGYNQTCIGLYNWGTSAQYIENDGASPSTLTLNLPNYDQSFSLTLRDGLNTLALVKTGAHTQTLAGTNTYSGSTTISAGTLALSGSGSITNSTSIVVASNAIFNVSGLSIPFTLAAAKSSQILSNSTSGAIISGTNNCSVGTISLVYDGVNPSFILTNGGMTLSAATTINVNNIGSQLAAGSYLIISNATAGAAGLVAGSAPSAVAVSGVGVATGASASLQIVSAGLNLVVVKGNQTIGFTNGLTTLTPTYGDAPLADAATNSSGLTLSYASDNSGVATVDANGNVTIVAAGSCHLVASNSGSAGYNSGSASQVLTVNALPVGLAGTRAYDGTTTATNSILAIANLVGADSFTVSGYAGLTGADVGTNAITSTNNLTLPLTGRATNYTLVGAIGYVVITNAAPVIQLAASIPGTNGYWSSLTFTSTLPAFVTSGNVIFLANSGAFSTNGITNGVACSLAITNLPRGANTISAQYAGNLPNVLGSTNSLLQVVTNHPPTAGVMTVTRTAGLRLLIALSDLATNWSDVDRDTVELTGVNMETTNGVNLMALNWTTNPDGSTVTTNASAYIGYTNSPNVADQISYSISDGQGGTNIGYVNIVIQSSVTGTNSITGITTGGANVVSAYGIVGFSYILERATNLAPAVWVDVSTNPAGTNGVINAVDTFWDLGGTPPGSAYYRLKWQP